LNAAAIPQLDEVWTVGDVAKLFKVSKSWVYLACEKYGLPHSRLGSHVRFDPMKVKAWFASKESKPGQLLSLVDAKKEK
jgi:excisionase family DNA binding protein